ncbi:MAG: metallophosphoesterase family protein [Candidatus Thorarchaeota archaeon]
MSKKRGIIIALSIAFTLMFNLPIITMSSNSPSMLSDTPWSDDTFCFIAYGDTRSGSPGNVSDLHDDIVGLYLQHDPELILHTGDLVYHGGEWYQYADFNDSIQQIWEYDVPLYIAAGNHEMYTDDWVNDPTFTNYTAFVDYSDVAAACGGTELYYSFDANGTHFIIINSELDWTWGPAEYNCSEAQMAWLEADLQTTDNDDFVVVAFHRPPFAESDSDLATEIREEFHTLFVSHGVDLVFNGHRHLYYRTVRDGIYYVVTGGGGAPLHDYQPDDPWRLEGDVIFSDYHYCIAKYESGNLNVEVVLMNGTIRDSFSLAIDSSSTPPPTTTTTTTNTPTTPTDFPPDNAMLYLAIGGGAIFIVLVVLYLGSKRK